MIRVRLESPDGIVVEAEGADGARLLDVAQAAGMPLEGTCDGDMACATCHVYVAPEWRDATGERTSDEKAMLGSTFGVRENSRLCCQIITSEDLDGLSVEVVGS